MAKSSDEDRESRLGVFIIANSIVWGLVMVGCALVLRGTDQMDRLIPIMAAGAGFSVVILPTLLIRKKRAEED